MPDSVRFVGGRSSIVYVGMAVVWTVVGYAEVLRSGVVSEEGFGCVARYLRAWQRRRNGRRAAWEDCGAPGVEVEVDVNS
jgi:hypothetical protein